MTKPILRIEITELATGERETVMLVDNDYFITTTGDCHVAGVQTYPGKGTHVLTIKGRTGQRE